jgi:hypothetical protein
MDQRPTGPWALVRKGFERGSKTLQLTSIKAAAK